VLGYLQYLTVMGSSPPPPSAPSAFSLLAEDKAINISPPLPNLLALPLPPLELAFFSALAASPDDAFSALASRGTAEGPFEDLADSPPSEEEVLALAHLVDVDAASPFRDLADCLFDHRTLVDGGCDSLAIIGPATVVLSAAAEAEREADGGEVAAAHWSEAMLTSSDPAEA